MNESLSTSPSLLPFLQCYAFAAVMLLSVRCGVWWRRFKELPPFWSWVGRGIYAFFFVIITALSLAVILGYHLSRTQGVSMFPTLQDGQMLLCDANAYVWRWPFIGKVAGAAQPPKPGDIVTLHHPDSATKKSSLFVKRIIAVGGSRVDLKNGVLFVDNVPEQFVKDSRGILYSQGHAVSFSTTPNQGFSDASWEVKPGEVFVVGDHRDKSWDSRSWGPVSVTTLASKVIGAVGYLGIADPDTAFKRVH